MSRSPQRLLDAPPSPILGVVVAIAAVAATTLIVFLVREVAPTASSGVVYLLPVLLVSSYWGLWLGLPTAFASALAFSFFHIAPTGRLTVAEPENWVALGVYLATAAVVSTMADLARSRAREAEGRRQEADLAAAMARMLLGGADLRTALPAASRRLAEALDLPGAEIVLDGGGGRPAVPLHLGAGRSAALVLPAGTDPGVVARVREHVVPALEALLRAALDRDALQAEVVETAALRRSDVLKTALLRAVSHDLRSPLTAILAAGDAVRSPQLPPEDREELGALVVEEAARLARLVENLLDLSRLQSGAADPRRDWCSIEEVVRDAADAAAASSLELELELDGDLPLVQADAAQLERVFVNLLENAGRHSGGRPVTVQARVVNDRMRVAVIDRGPGIDGGELERVFEAFHRGPGADGRDGSGLGLAIARGFAEANSGRVWAESELGRGSVFTVELPVAARGAPVEAGRR